MPQTEFSINAWISPEKPATSPVEDARAESWALGQIPDHKGKLAGLEVAIDPSNWRDPLVGWGLILLGREDMSAAELASVSDAPAPIQELLKARPGSPVFRYIPDSADPDLLRTVHGDVPIINDTMGTAPGALPSYLLIYGSPADIPWDLQYTLNTSSDRSVGRLDLTGEALENYVGALIKGWPKSKTSYESSVTWAVDLGDTDITHLMRDAVAARAHDALVASGKIKNAKFIDGASVAATADALIDALVQHKPGTIITTSHGQTSAHLAILGLPVDHHHKLLQPSALLSDWEPDGALWYSHACCSAGSSERSQFLDLVGTNSGIAEALTEVANLGANVAPLPRALLGAKKPLRAFIGHVEPTFDWTLAHAKTGQWLTGGIVRSIAGQVAGRPVGLSFQDFFETISPVSALYEGAKRQFQAGKNTQDAMIRMQLFARDTWSTVIIGDPTAMLP